MNNKRYKWFISTFFALNLVSISPSVNALDGDYGRYQRGGAQQHGHQSEGRNEYPRHSGHPSQAMETAPAYNQHGHSNPQGNNMHGHGRSEMRRPYYHNGQYYNYHRHGSYYNYYHDGEYYNYYHKGKYYRYLVNGAYYNYLYRGSYYVYFVNGRYYNYFYNGAYYNDCRKNPGYWAQGVWRPAVMVCR